MSEHARWEEEVRALHAAGDMPGAVTCAIRRFGPQLYGFLVTLLCNEQDAGDAFAMLSEDIWRGLPGFRWACSFRTWAFTLARNAAHRQQRKRARQGPEIRLSTSLISELAEEVITSYVGKRSELDEMRDALPEEDRTILVLRIDKGLSWTDVARVLAGDTEGPEPAIAREAARVRKRFQLVKQQLVAAARERGLVAAAQHDTAGAKELRRG